MKKKKKSLQIVHKAKVFGSIQQFYVHIVWIVAVFLKQKRKKKN